MIKNIQSWAGNFDQVSSRLNKNYGLFITNEVFSIGNFFLNQSLFSHWAKSSKIWSKIWIPIQPSFFIKQWNNVVLSLLVLKVGKSRSFLPSVMRLDHLVGQLYRKFFQQKSSCELILHSKWSRWKRAVTDNSYSASYSSMSDCCPPVVDPLTFISLLGTIHKWRHAKNWKFDAKLSVIVSTKPRPR